MGVEGVAPPTAKVRGYNCRKFFENLQAKTEFVIVELVIVSRNGDSDHFCARCKDENDFKFQILEEEPLRNVTTSHLDEDCCFH